MGEIPVPLVRTNQLFLVACAAATVLLRQPWPAALALLTVGLGLIAGPRAQLTYQLGRMLWGQRLATAPTEDGRMQRFNQTLAATMLVACLLCWLLRLNMAAWVLAGLLGAVALAGACGFCLGCRLYRWIGPWMRARA